MKTEKNPKINETLGFDIFTRTRQMWEPFHELFMPKQSKIFAIVDAG